MSGPLSSTVRRHTRYPDTAQFTLADGRQVRVDGELHDRLASHGVPLGGAILLDRLVGDADPTYEQWRIDDATVVYAAASAMLLEIRDRNGYIIYLQDGYIGTTRDPDARSLPFTGVPADRQQPDPSDPSPEH